MKVLFAASEAAPFIKTGGLADVMGALPKELRKQGVETALVLPKYASIADKYQEQMEHVYEGTVDLSWRKQYVGVDKLVVDGVPCFFIDNEYYFKREGLYGYYDDAERFAYFSKAVLAILPHIGFRPDIIHTNDWHTGLVGTYLKEEFQQDPFYAGIKNVFTIHNLKYQGIYGRDLVEDVLGLSMRLYYNGNIENGGCVNFLKAGMHYADVITTVSPTYAQEIHYAYFGEGLEDYVRMCDGKLVGILNGMDETVFNPATDPYIAYPYTGADLFSRKSLNKMALQKELGLPVNRQVPMLAMITRLVEAKGMDLVTFIMDEMMQEDIQFVVIGTGERRYEEALQDLARRYPDKVSVNIRFSEELAHKVYASADLFLMPSRYEACGMSQMIAMRYGTVPVVREVGGLKDTVHNYEKHVGAGNGLTFVNFNAHELLFTVKRGLSYYEEEPVWEKLVMNAFHSNNSWDRPAAAYAVLYREITGEPGGGGGQEILDGKSATEAAGDAETAETTGAPEATETTEEPQAAGTSATAGTDEQPSPNPGPGTPGHALDTVTEAVQQVIEQTTREADARAKAKAAAAADTEPAEPAEPAEKKAPAGKAPRKTARAAAKASKTKAAKTGAKAGTKAKSAGKKAAAADKPKTTRRKRTAAPADPAPQA
ncbi:MAG: Glycogen synthase [Succiniclasticum sp.]|jgi:starch synthase